MSEAPMPVIPSPQPTAAPILARSSRWHVPIGIIAVALGGLTLVLSAIGMAGTSLGGRQAETMKAMPAWYGSFARLEGVVGAGIALLLLGGGILLLKRRTAGRGLLLAYAALKIMASLLVGVITYRAASEMTGEGMQADMMRMGMRLGAVMSVLIGWAFPVFLAVWFCRWKVRTDMQSWTPDGKAS